MKRQKRCSSEQDKNCPLFLSTPFSWTIPQSLSLTLSKASAFSSTAHCPWKISSNCPQQHTVHGQFHQTAKFCYYQLHRTSSVRKYLSTEATVKLATSLILSRLHYCGSLLSGPTVSSVHSLRQIQNSAARLITEKKRKTGVTECIVCVSGHDPLTFSFLSFLFFDWVGVSWPQLSKVLKLVRWASSDRVPGEIKSFCLPVYLRCNGVNDCPGREDEAGCEE